MQVFFVIRLIAGPTANSLPAITDPDPLMACDLMDGRDAFLTLARDKHLEFSSLRRSKWSSMCMLVELHNQSQDRFVYTCNECKRHVETRFHCTVCEVRAGRELSATQTVTRLICNGYPIRPYTNLASLTLVAKFSIVEQFDLKAICTFFCTFILRRL